MKKLRISLFIISLILSATALYTLFIGMPNNDFSIKDLPIIIYFIGILITGILTLFPKLNYLTLIISILLLIVTILTWIRFPQIGIIYTPFIVYLVLCLAFSFYSVKK